MNRIVLVFCLVFVSFLFTGCSDKVHTTIENNQETINRIVNVAAHDGAYQGFKLWAKKDNAAAMEAATALSKNLNSEVIPYLDGADLHTSAEINEFINSSLFKNVHEEIKDTIVIASGILDVYLPVPSAEKLKPEYLTYLKSFITGLQSGAEKFSTASNDKQQRIWINGNK